MSTFGYFENEHEFVFTTPETPRPMLNYFWNDRLLSGVNQTGGGNGAYGGYTQTYVDPHDRGRCAVIRDGNRYFYIQDAASGDVFSPGWYPVKAPVEDYRCVHGLGYSHFSSRRGGIAVKLRGFVGPTHPAEIWTITLTNESSEERQLKTYSFVEFQLEGYQRASDYNSYVYARVFPEDQLLVCHNDAIERPHEWFHGFVASSVPYSAFDTSKRAFLGEYGNPALPTAVAKAACSNSLAACEPMVGALQHDFTLAPGQSTTFHILFGTTDSDERAQTISRDLFTPGRIEAEFTALTSVKAAFPQLLQVQTPDPKINRFTNYWLKQQVQLCAEIGRDGCKGFRDQLQDAWAVAGFNPQLARAKILETLQYMYEDGRCERGWLPVLYRVYSDGPVWIPLALNGYLKETGDYAILEEVVPYFQGGSGTVLEHMLVALRRSYTDLGEHGLVHALEGDWNDSLNMIGREGKGESVWTSIALVWALREMAEIAEFVLKDPELTREMRGEAAALANKINAEAWDGQWYLAAFNDEGEKVGTHEETEGRVYLNPQTWAILAGVAEGDRLTSCVDTLDTMLDSPYGPLTLSPPYTKFNPGIGRLTSFVPGIWENGAPYCHGGTFKIVSDCVLGRGDKAYQTMLAIMPDSEQNPSDHSGCEPYALTNMYLGPSNPRAGETIYAWVTGTAGWMYRAITQYMLGFHPGYDRITIDPCLPSSWTTCEMRREFRGDVYELLIEKPLGVQKGVRWLEVDGIRQESNSFPLFGDGASHQIKVLLG